LKIRKPLRESKTLNFKTELTSWRVPNQVFQISFQSFKISILKMT